MTKTRIIKRTKVDGTIKYIIQQKHFLFKWIWVDAFINTLAGFNNESQFWQFDSLNFAKTQLCYFDGSKHTDEVIE